MEIERKYLIPDIPSGLDIQKTRLIEQGYLCTSPVVRIRRDNDEYFLTYKSKGLMVREEFELPRTEEAYRGLLAKADGTVITKERYYLPYGAYTIELDRFGPPFAPLTVAEVEFPTREEALAFTPPDWFGREVTGDPAYTNASMSRKKD